ncbi:MAG TPA: hypothetical protein VE954_36825, partial [Oligoflexus sp.]|uniref:hypothetical protein n=1 Tax=Oligoflexus sp. TaxID=1971216 RepID=UPI002D5EDF6D
MSLTDKERIEALIIDGRLAEKEGRQILKTLDSVEGRTRPQTSGKAKFIFNSPLARLKAELLLGRMSDEAFERFHKRLTIIMGVMFTAVFTLVK